MGVKPARAKLFVSGGSPAARTTSSGAPRTEGKTAALARGVGRRLVLEPQGEWPESFLRCLGSVSGELERPPRPSVKSLRDPFA